MNTRLETVSEFKCYPIATIMSVYKGDCANYFRQAIDSILHQDLPEHVESRIYLAIDGPVGHELRQEIQSYSNRIYKLIEIPENGGLARALNKLITSLEDEGLVFRMDADDISLPDRYRKQIAYLDKNKDIDILGTALLEMVEGESFTRVVHFCDGPEDGLKKLGWRVPVGHPSVCYRRWVLDEVGSYPDVKGNEDIAMWFLCARKGFSFDNITEPLLRFRVSDNFWKRRGYQKAYTEWRVYMKGGYALNGLSFNMVLASFRFVFRLFPTWLSKFIYQSKIRA